jgi:putative membrane protein
LRTFWFSFLIAVLAASYRWLALSDYSYLLIFVFLGLHECGAHYQYGSSILGAWMKLLVPAERNHYDRLVHFMFGLLLSYPQPEILMRKAGLRGGWPNVLPVFTTVALSANYEMIEAVTATIVDPKNAEAFLGSQEDQWDPQEDMFMALAGASVFAVAAAVISRTRSLI